MTVLVLADRGLWSPRLWDAIRALRLAPAAAPPPEATFRPAGRQARCGPRAWCPGPGHAWVGAGTAFKDRRRAPGRHPGRRLGGRPAPSRGWCLTDLAPDGGGAVLVRAAGLDRAGLPGAEGAGLALGADPAHRPRAGGAPLAGAGGGHAVGAGDRHPRPRTPSGWGRAPANLRAARCPRRRAVSPHRQRLRAAGWPGCAGNCCACAGCGRGSGSGRSPGPTPPAGLTVVVAIPPSLPFVIPTPVSTSDGRGGWGEGVPEKFITISLPCLPTSIPRRTSRAWNLGRPHARSVLERTYSKLLPCRLTRRTGTRAGVPSWPGGLG